MCMGLTSAGTVLSPALTLARRESRSPWERWCGHPNGKGVESSGLDETALVGRAMTACADEVRKACERLPALVRMLWMSCRCSVCFKSSRSRSIINLSLSRAPPWHWPAWWQNTIIIGEGTVEQQTRLLRPSCVLPTWTVTLSTCPERRLAIGQRCLHVGWC
jgi:hypothetical protein